MWIAIHRDTNHIVAVGNTYMQCSNAALDTELWDKQPGTVAPYYFTTGAIMDCHCCYGTGKIVDYDYSTPCIHCGGYGCIVKA